MHLKRRDLPPFLFGEATIAATLESQDFGPNLAATPLTRRPNHETHRSVHRHQPRRHAAAFDRRERPWSGSISHAERLEPGEPPLVLAHLRLRRRVHLASHLQAD